MKILELGKFYPIRGGVEKVMWDITTGVSERGVDCDMLCACQEPQVIRLNEHGRVICVRSLMKLAATMISPAMIFWLRKHGKEYDIIHIHHPDPMACLALFLSGYKGRVILHWHSDILKQKTLMKFYRPLQSWLIGRSERIVGTTPVYVAESKALAKVQDKVTYIPIGVHPVCDAAAPTDSSAPAEAPTDLAPTAATPTGSAQTESAAPAESTASFEGAISDSSDTSAENPADALSEAAQVVTGPVQAANGVTLGSITPGTSAAPAVTAILERFKGRKIVYSLGRLVSYKGYEYLVDAAGYLSDDYVVAIGGDGPLREELQRRIEEKGLQDKVFLLGRIPDDQFASWYMACVVFCLSSVWKTEAFAIVQVEAMSCAKPVVATRIPGSGVSWVNAHGESGVNVEPFDAGALAEAIMYVTDAERYESFCRGALNRFRTMFTFDGMIDRCLELYETVAGDINSAFLKLLRNALWGSSIENWPRLSARQWKELYAFAEAHTLGGILFDALGSLPEDCVPPQEVLDPWLVAVQRTEDAFALHSKVAGTQRGTWEKRGLDALLLKGLNSAAMYRVPEHRTCGDIDWYFGSGDDWQAANDIAAGSGCKLETDSDGDVHYLLSGVVVEHHRRWNDASSARARRVIDELSPESPEAQLIMRNVHILKHVMVGGIGLRQFCDLAVAYRYYDGQYDPVLLSERLREAGLGKWNRLLNAFLVQVLGCEYVEKDDTVPDSDMEYLVATVFDDGNFGTRRYAGSSTAGGRGRSGDSPVGSGKPTSTTAGGSDARSERGALVLMRSALSRSLLFLRYAPYEFVCRIRSLATGRIKRKIKNT